MIVHVHVSNDTLLCNVIIYHLFFVLSSVPSFSEFSNIAAGGGHGGPGVQQSCWH